MSQILDKVRVLDPNNSELIKETLAVFFQNSNKNTEPEFDRLRWLRATESIINRFPKYCISHRNNIESYLANLLNSSNYGIVIEAAKCAHVLQQVRPTYEKSATAKSCWRNQMNALCDAINSLLSAIFPNAVDMYKNSGSAEKDPESMSQSALTIALNEIGITRTLDKHLNKRSILFTRLRNIFVFLQAMLVEIYPVPKPVQPQVILEVIVRALSVTSGNTEQSENKPYIATIKIETLRTVDALVECLGANLIPFSSLVFKFVMQTLRWSSDKPGEGSSKVRCAAYNTLIRWLGVLHVHRISNEGRARSWEDELVLHIIGDITPPKHVVQLTMNSQPTRHLSKKARRKMTNSMLQESSIASHAPGEKNKVKISEEMNDEVAIAALECAETFLIVCGIFLKPATHKLFHEHLVRECFTLEKYSSERALALLIALEAARKSTPPSVPPPTQYCLHLYSMLVGCQQREISKFSSHALLDIRLHLHCSPPSLNFAMEITEDRQKDRENKTKRMTERNRAALEALLGREKVTNNEVSADEIITIPDEPSSKKPRLEEEVSDKISVSSDSVSSVEISDDSEEDIEMVPLVDEVDTTTTNTKENVEMDEVTVNETEINVNETQISVNETEITNSSKEDEGEITLTDALGNKTTVNTIIPTLNTISEKSAPEEISKELTQSDEKSVPEENIKELTQSDQNTQAKENISIAEEEKDVQLETESIFEAKTQMPTNASADTVEEEEMPLSIEIAYDLPNTAKEVPVLEKMEDENLPSTSDTDDIQITCGQVIRSSPDEIEKNKEIEEKIDEPKVNGNKSPEKTIADNVSPPEATECVTVKKTVSNEVSVDDMLADFVDEVIEESNV